ncbi:alpha-L RNA-binding motif-containing protein [Teratosphaeria nubilosa]|uniref:Alpha-L RNA-binding motif-containing protein n=1 Tax=Teratosphaeria nubilosa TaxID=161662 RepID=A0A6G1L609_9PEZI|nr:alpha-L RNA-binding motif-containing protein [Teratosphaeria nubilosa]
MPRIRRHALKNFKVRQDWSKENLYNLSRLSTPTAVDKTFFQQKWIAKRMTRGFHSPHVREGQWTRMFDRRLPAVVSMDHRYLARYDGSEQGSGRGSGLDKIEERQGDGRRQQRTPKTPYMNMTFHPLERRLDTAIWRALFASSVRQARQFVVHGHVKVNGKKMEYPGYQLNPGDMFQVDPDSVMYATGAKKLNSSSPDSGQDERQRREAEEESAGEESARREAEEEERRQDEAVAELKGLSLEEREAYATNPEDEQDAKKAMKNLITRAKRILEDSKRSLSGKRQQELRAFSQLVKDTMSKHGAAKGEASSALDSVEDLEQALAEIMTKIPEESLPSKPETSSAEMTVSSNPQAQNEDKYNARRDAELLSAALERARANPIDVTKPYATPWKPRDYMSPFAFIPRYLEVNQNICSAVYLRHPVARPGLAEVPTPFHHETLELAFNWYLRRR